MTTLEKLKAFTWINRSELEKVCGIPNHTLQLNEKSKRVIPQKWLDKIEEEFIKFSCSDNTFKEEEPKPITVKMTKKEKVKVAQVIELAKEQDVLPIEVLIDIHKAESIDKIKEIIDNGQRKTINISSEWDDDFTMKIIKLKDIIADNTPLEVIDGNGMKFPCYSKGKEVINANDNLPQKWTYLPKAYLLQ